jgi:hypothetical protein
MINIFTDTTGPASLTLVRGPFTAVIHFDGFKTVLRISYG